MRTMTFAFLGLASIALVGRGLGEDPPLDREALLLRLLEEALAAGEAEPSVLGDIDLARASPEVRKAARVLRSRTTDLVLDKADLPSVLRIFQEASGIPFLASAKARAAMETAKPQLTLALRGIPLESALNLVAIVLGDYRFVLRHGAVLLVLAEEHRTVRVTRAYDVSDVVRPRPDFPAPPLGLGTPER